MPHHPDAVNLLGVISHQTGQNDKAVELIKKAIRANPANPTYYYNLAVVYQALNNLDEAVACYKKALTLKHDYVDAHNNLGVLLKEQGKVDEAIACYQKVLALNPGYANTYSNLGAVLREQGRLDEAESHCRKALALNSNHFEAYSNLGAALKEQGKLDEAADCFRRALALNPNYVEAYSNLGSVFKDQNKMDDAVACYQRALELRPDLADLHYNLGGVLKDQGKLDEAIACYQRALQLDPDFPKADNNLLFCYNYHPTLAAEDIFAAYRRWNDQRAAALALDAAPFPNARDAQRRLRIGYVSPDFRNHSVIHFAAPLIEHHDKARFEVFCYYNHHVDDASTARIRAAADHWIACVSLSDAELAQRVRADGIDLLIDLAGHTAGNRLLAFARKPAPVQVSWLGYGYTTGLTAIDYFIGDAVFTPPGSEPLFSETLYRLPHACWTYQPPEAPAPGELPARRRGHVTLACLSRSERINARLIEAWAAILRRLPEARLRLDSRNFADAGLCRETEMRFTALGVPPSRLELGFTSPVWDVYRDVDLVLDCFPHNSGTTTFEALWMGLPVITLAERPSVGRFGASILSAIGKPEWIAHDSAGYVARAVALAQDTDRLARERATLRAAMRASPLLAHAAFARDMEAAYREMWRKWGDGAPAEELHE